MSIKIERLAAKDYAPTKGLNYLDTNGFFELFDSLAFHGNHVMSGPKGIAKSLCIQAYAAKVNCPIITFDCSEDVRRSHLIGKFVPRSESEIPFILGPLTTAIEIANEKGNCILCLEELNALAPTMQKILNPLTDFRRRIEVPECKKVFRLKDKAKLWVVGTMNLQVYGGVFALNADLISRFSVIPCSYPQPHVEQEILKSLVEGVTEEEIQTVLRLATETRTQSFEYALGSRDVQQILENMVKVGLEKALWISTGKFEGNDLITYKKRIESHFGIKV